MTYEPKTGEVVRGVGRSGKTYVGAFRQHSSVTTGESTLTLQQGNGDRPSGRVFVQTTSLEPIDPDDVLSCELCGENVDDETGTFWDAIGQRNVVAHGQCGIDAGYALA